MWEASRAAWIRAPYAPHRPRVRTFQPGMPSKACHLHSTRDVFSIIVTEDISTVPLLERRAAVFYNLITVSAWRAPTKPAQSLSKFISMTCMTKKYNRIYCCTGYQLPTPATQPSHSGVWLMASRWNGQHPSGDTSGDGQQVDFIKLQRHTHTFVFIFLATVHSLGKTPIPTITTLTLLCPSLNNK